MEAVKRGAGGRQIDLSNSGQEFAFCPFANDHLSPSLRRRLQMVRRKGEGKRDPGSIVGHFFTVFFPGNRRPPPSRLFIEKVIREWSPAFFPALAVREWFLIPSKRSFLRKVSIPGCSGKILPKKKGRFRLFGKNVRPLRTWLVKYLIPGSFHHL